MKKRSTIKIDWDEVMKNNPSIKRSTINKNAISCPISDSPPAIRGEYVNVGRFLVVDGERMCKITNDHISLSLFGKKGYLFPLNQLNDVIDKSAELYTNESLVLKNG